MTDKTEEPKTNMTWDKTIVIPEMKDLKCQHYFEFVNGECRCRSCHMGLIGVVNIVDGKPQ